MTAKEFIDWALKNGPLDWDKAYSAQCVDLFRFFHNKCINSLNQPKSVVGAKNFWTNYESDPVLNQNYSKIENTPEYVPKIGDVIIWKNGTYGHIAIATGEGNTSKFKSLDQNYTNKNEIAIVEHTYGYVYGCFRPLKITQDSMQDDLKSILDYYRVKTKDELIKMVDEQLKFLKDERLKNSGLEEQLKLAQDKHRGLIEYIITKIAPLRAFIDQSEESAKGAIVELVSLVDSLNDTIRLNQKEAEKKEQELVKKNEDLQSKLDTLQAQFDKLKQDHARELETMQNRIDKVQEQVEANSKEVTENNKFKQFLKDFITKLLKG